MIHLKGVTKTFGRHQALKDVSLEVPEKRIFGLLGPNGAGKTTLLRLLMGVLVPDEGEITLFGRYTPGMAQATRQIGYMPQQLALYEGLTIRENVRFFGHLYGMEKAALHQSCEEALRRVDLLGRADDLALTLSGGMQRRVMLATAMVHKPKLLILDEPTAGIDPVLRLNFWAWFRDLANEGATILVTTHHISEADHCQEVLFLREGHLLEQGNPASLISKYKVADLEAAFVQATQQSPSGQEGAP